MFSGCILFFDFSRILIIIDTFAALHIYAYA